VERVDYAGIDALTSISFYPPGDYSFTGSRILQGVYMGSITVLGFATIIFTLLPSFPRPDFRSFPAALFLGMGLSGVAPIFHKLMHDKKQPEALQTTGFEILMGILHGIQRIDIRTYATRIPERWKPGKFGVAGHSHRPFTCRWLRQGWQFYFVLFEMIEIFYINLKRKTKWNNFHLILNLDPFQNF